jgi:hypothetical protein
MIALDALLLSTKSRPAGTLRPPGPPLSLKPRLGTAVHSMFRIAILFGIKGKS